MKKLPKFRSALANSFYEHALRMDRSRSCKVGGNTCYRAPEVNAAIKNCLNNAMAYGKYQS